MNVDDNPVALKALRQLIEQVNFLRLKGEFTTALEAFSFLEMENIDLLFLDIELPDINGLKLIEKLADPPLIIMVTAKAEYALEAFEKHVVDYLVKPVELPRFLSSVNFAKKIYDSRRIARETQDTLFVKADSKWHKLFIPDIIYLQAMGDYVRIFSGKESYMVNKTMKAMEESLPPNKFFRVHRSYMVNIDHIDNIQDNTIVIGRDVIPISERYKSVFMERLNLL